MDVEADNRRHQLEERARQQKRRDKRANKSESQLERENRRREHRQRIISEQNKQNKRHKSGHKSRSTPKKPPPPSSDDKGGGSSKFQALFAKRSEGFLIDLNFRNAAPRPPVGPCFVGLGLDGELNDKWTKYKINNAVESNYAMKLHAEPDLGVPLAPSAMDLEGCYVDPTKADEKKKMDAYDELFDDEDEAEEKKENKGAAPLHPDDEMLINWKGYAGDSAAEQLQERRDMARTQARLQGTNSGKRTSSSGPQEQIALLKRTVGFQSRVLDESNPFFMKETTYLANNFTQSVHGTFKSLAETKAQAAAEIERKLKANKNKLSDKDAIQKSFESANKSGVKRVHPAKKSVEAVCEIPLFPDDITWAHTFTHVVLDNLPKMESNNEITSSQLGSAYIGDVNKVAQNLRMECNLLTTDNNSDADAASSEKTYSAIQKYDLDVIHLREENAPNMNFVFMLDEEKMVASYHPVSSRVQLSTGRPAHSQSTSRSISKREMTEEEVAALEKNLAEIDADMAQKHDMEDGRGSSADNGQSAGTKRQNPFAAIGGGSDSDSSDSEEEDSGF